MHERHLCGHCHDAHLVYARLRRFHERISALSFFSAADGSLGSLLNLVRQHPEVVLFFVLFVLGFMMVHGFISMMAIYPYVVDSGRSGGKYRPAIALDAVTFIYMVHR